METTATFVTLQLQALHRNNVMVHFGHTRTLWRSCSEEKTVELTSQHLQRTVCNDLLHGDPTADPSTLRDLTEREQAFQEK